MIYVWDNSNIVESYPGVCSPLTFSFARYVYREVYLQTALLFGVDRRLTQKLYRKLETFLGYVDGRFYYNLGTWCTLISYLPGFSENPKLLQEMMGVKPGDRIETLEVPVPRLARIKLLAKFIYYHFALDGMTDRWIKDFERDLPEHVRRLDRLQDPHELMTFFFDIEYRYLRHWQIPILNDFSVMIYSGLLRRTSIQYLGRELDPKQITGIGQTGNTRLVEQIKELAHVIRADASLLCEFRSLEPEVLWEHLQARPEIRTRLDQFFCQFGLRNGHNLKLETPNLQEEPAAFVKLLRQYVFVEDLKELKPQGSPDSQELASVPRLRRAILHFLIRHTKGAVRRREEMRNKRSQIFGVVRQVFVKIGCELAKQGLIDDPADVFYVEMDEIFGRLQGTATLKDLRVLVQQREKELANAAPSLRSHFTTEGIPFQGTAYREARETNERTRELVGSPNFPARVTGEVIVMERPDFSQDVRDKILVCRQTDPNWVPFLGLIKGIVVERGGILSHAAIVCRELQVPSVIGVEHATEILQTGQRVQLDSVAGKVKVL